jgi:serine/threonine-protein kinase
LVAVKVIRPDGADRDALARFAAEGQLLARLTHPNVVRVYEAGQADGVPFLCMEYVEGTTLHWELAGRPAGHRRAAALVADIARGVAEAHHAGVLHRDLKPANVLVAADGTPKVTDFGLATTFDAGERLTHTGEVIGTPD